MLPLLVVWVAIVVLEYARGVRPELISYGSQAAFIPVWFLAVYIGIVLLAPAMEAAWARFGMKSFWALRAAAIIVDVMYFAVGLRWLGFANYLFVWGAIFLLGYAWLDERFSGWRTLLVCAALGFGALVLLVRFGPYPVAMLGVPGDPVSATTPPKVCYLRSEWLPSGYNRGTIRAVKPARRDTTLRPHGFCPSAVRWTMRDVLRSNDSVVISFAQSVLQDAGIASFVADQHVSAAEGSIGAFPRRLLVDAPDWAAARRLLADAGLGAWLFDDGSRA